MDGSLCVKPRDAAERSPRRLHHGPAATDACRSPRAVKGSVVIRRERNARLSAQPVDHCRCFLAGERIARRIQTVRSLLEAIVPPEECTKRVETTKGR